MIKLLKNKMLIALFLLVIGISVTSSCYATSTYTYDDFEWSVDKTNNTFTITNIPLQISETFDIGYDVSCYSKYIVSFYDINEYSSSFSEYYSFGILFCNEYKWSKYGSLYYIDTNDGICGFFDFRISTSGKATFDKPWAPVFFNDFSNYRMSGRGGYWLNVTLEGNLARNVQIVDSTFNNITNPVTNEVIYKKSASTDFNYKFEAETKNRLALTITDLDSSYKMIGFVDNSTTYEVGDVLSAGIDIAYQRITPRRFR